MYCLHAIENPTDLNAIATGFFKEISFHLLNQTFYTFNMKYNLSVFREMLANCRNHSLPCC